MKSFALSRQPSEDHPYSTEVDLWCTWATDQSDRHWFYGSSSGSKEKKKKAKGKGFYVINGAWYGHFDKKTGILTCHAPYGDTYWPAQIVWEGDAPFRDSDYNAAMNWIREQIGVTRVIHD